MVWHVIQTYDYKGYEIKLLDNWLGYVGILAEVCKDDEIVDKRLRFTASEALLEAEKLIDELVEFDLPFPIVGV